MLSTFNEYRPIKFWERDEYEPYLLYDKIRKIINKPGVEIIWAQSPYAHYRFEYNDNRVITYGYPDIELQRCNVKDGRISFKYEYNSPPFINSFSSNMEAIINRDLYVLCTTTGGFKLREVYINKFNDLMKKRGNQ